MRVYGICSNGLSCNVGHPQYGPCSFRFQSSDYVGLFSRKLLKEYIRAQYNTLRMEQYNQTLQAMIETTSVDSPQAMKSDGYNYYFHLNDGFLEINYADETTQIVSNTYTSSEWTNYKDVWSYDKDCVIRLHNKSYFLWLSLVDAEPDQVNVKVLRLKREDSTPASYNTTLSGENVLYVCGQNYTINGRRYDEYNKDFVSHMQSFSNVTSLSVSTESCASLVLIEKKID